MADKFLTEISALNERIANEGDKWALYYQRGYFHFLSDDNEKAKDDYKHSLALGLDPTEEPYYSFSASNSKRRPFLLPEKLMVAILLIMILAALAFQIFDFVSKIKGSL